MKKHEDEVTTRIRTNIRRIRIEKGLSIPKLANAAGISLSGMKFIESGHIKPKESRLKAICGALGVTVEDVNSIAGKAAKKATSPASMTKSNMRPKDDYYEENASGNIRLELLSLLNTFDDGTIGILLDFAKGLSRSRVKNRKASNDSF